MEAIGRELKARPANGERFLKALQHFCTRARENRWRLRCGRMAEAFSSLDEGLRGLRRQHRRGEESTYEAVNTAVIQQRVIECDRHVMDINRAQIIKILLIVFYRAYY